MHEMMLIEYINPVEYVASNLLNRLELCINNLMKKISFLLMMTGEQNLN